METNPQLLVKDLTVQLSGQTVLHAVSFTVNKGEQLAVIGPSGSGKTTLINTITGKHFSRGTVSFAANKGLKP